MLKRILILIAIGCSCLNAFPQFFIPIIIPYSVESYVCNTQNKLAREHYQEANNNFHTNVSLSVSYYSEAIKLDSFFCDAYYGLVKSYNKLKYYNNAMEITNLALKINSIQPWFMKQKGILYLRLKEYQSAADYFENMIEV